MYVYINIAAYIKEGMQVSQGYTGSYRVSGVIKGFTGLEWAEIAKVKRCRIVGRYVI